MAQNIRISKRTVDALKAGETEFVAWDADLSGFGVRVRTSGAKSYVAVYRGGSGRGAPLRRFTIGPVGKLTPDEARAKAKAVLGSAVNGVDPAAAKSEARASATIGDLIDHFLADHVATKRKAGTAGHYRDILERIVRPELGKAKAAKVSRADLARLHLKWKRTPYQANRMLAIVGSMYSFAGKRGLAPEGSNPARGVEKYPEEGRERFLSTAELERLGEAIREAETDGLPWQVDETSPNAKHVAKIRPPAVMSPHAAGALRLLAFTGCRLREILHLKWQHVDFERGMLFLSDSKTGRKTVVLNAPALAVLASLPRVGAYVIAGERAGEDSEKPRADLKRPWASVTGRAGLAGLRIHDLRHSFASVGAGGGMGLPIVGKLLGHANAVTTARYAHLDSDPLRRASNAIGGAIAAAMSGGTAAAVIPFKREA